MASVRIHRQSCETGRLPRVCICCGAPATNLLRNRFHCEPAWQILMLPVIWLLMVLVGIFTGLRAKRLYNPLAADPIEFPVPLCAAHGQRLNWHRNFLWALAALLFVAVAILVPTCFSIAIAGDQDISGRLRLVQIAVVVTIVGAGVLLLLSVLLRLGSPRVISYTSNHIDMDLVAEPFVTALQRTKSSQVPGDSGTPMGISFVPATQGSTPASANVVVIVGGTMVALVSSCCLSGLAMQYWLTWHNNRNLDRFRADVKKIHDESVAESNKRAEALAKQNPFASRPPVSPFAPPPFGPGGYPPFAPFPPGAEASAFPPGMPPGMMPGMPPGMVPGMPPAMPPGMPGPTFPSTRTSSSSVPRGETREQFFPRGSERVPPNSREISDTAELAPGAEVWALKGSTWYRAVVIQAESPFITRVHYYGWSAIHDSPIPASMIRIAEDRAGSAPATPVATAPVIDAPPRSDVPPRTSRSRSSRSSTPAPVSEEQTPPPSITPSPSLPTSPASASRRRTWSDTTGQFQVDATFVRLSSGMVTLRRQDDQDIEIPLHRLCPDDQKTAEELAKSK